MRHHHQADTSELPDGGVLAEVLIEEFGVTNVEQLKELTPQDMETVGLDGDQEKLFRAIILVGDYRKLLHTKQHKRKLLHTKQHKRKLLHTKQHKRKLLHTNQHKRKLLHTKN